MSAAASTVRVVANFAVRLVHGPGWDPAFSIRGQDAWDEHAAFVDGLVNEGFITLGGPAGDGEQTLHAVEAADENEIRARLAQDPWASAGCCRSAPLSPGRSGSTAAQRTAHADRATGPARHSPRGVCTRRQMRMTCLLIVTSLVLAEFVAMTVRPVAPRQQRRVVALALQVPVPFEFSALIMC